MWPQKAYTKVISVFDRLTRILDKHQHGCSKSSEPLYQLAVEYDEARFNTDIWFDSIWLETVIIYYDYPPDNPKALLRSRCLPP